MIGIIRVRSAAMRSRVRVIWVLLTFLWVVIMLMLGPGVVGRARLG